MSKLFLDTLDNNRRQIFSNLKNFSELGILGGGTALALQIGHRISYDFDIFINGPIESKIWKKSKDVFGSDAVKILENEDQLDLITPNSIKVTFFHDDYQHMFDTVKTETIDLMNVKDIAANKALIQSKRPKWRDYVDLYFLLKYQHIDLSELINLSNRKFKNDFSEKLFLEQLVYWDDVNSYEIEYIGNEIDTAEIKDFLVRTVKDYKSKFI